MTPEHNPADDVQPTKEEWEAYEAQHVLASATACRCGVPGPGNEFICMVEASGRKEGKCACSCHIRDQRTSKERPMKIAGRTPLVKRFINVSGDTAFWYLQDGHDVYSDSGHWTHWSSLFYTAKRFATQAAAEAFAAEHSDPDPLTVTLAVGQVAEPITAEWLEAKGFTKYADDHWRIEIWEPVYRNASMFLAANRKGNPWVFRGCSDDGTVIDSRPKTTTSVTQLLVALGVKP